MQRFSSPRTQKRHAPHVERNHAIPLRSALGKALRVPALCGHAADCLMARTTPGRRGARSPPRGAGPCGRRRRRAPSRGSRSGRLGNVAVDEAQRALGGRRRVIKRPGPHAAAEPDPAEADPFQRRPSRRRLESRGDELRHPVTRCTVRPSRTFAGTSSNRAIAGRERSRSTRRDERRAASASLRRSGARDRSGDLAGHADLGAHRPT